MASVIEEIKKAGKEKKLITISYRKVSGEISTSDVESYEIKGIYFWAVDTVDNGIRQFKLNNILSVEILDETYTPQFPVKF